MIGAWRRWAFTPADTAPMAALRIACGILVLGWTASLLPDAQPFLGAGGVAPAAVNNGAGWWTLPVNPYADCALLALAALAMTLGWRSRASSAVVALLRIVLQRQDVWVLDSGDQLLRELCIYVALMPSGETWSLDARRRPSQPRAPWALRLLQVQISIVYLFALMSKLHGDTWQNGSAVGIILQVGDMQRLTLPHAIANSVLAAALLTYGTLVTEAFLILGLWHPKTRWWAMGAGTAMHLGIEATLLTGWFSLTIIACYLAFVPPATLRKAAGRCLGWLPGMRESRLEGVGVPATTAYQPDGHDHETGAPLFVRRRRTGDRGRGEHGGGGERHPQGGGAARGERGDDGGRYSQAESGGQLKSRQRTS